MQHKLGRSFGKLFFKSIDKVLEFQFMKYIFVFLLQDEIENMVREGEKHAAADAEKKERIEAVNQGKIHTYWQIFVKGGCKKVRLQISEVEGKII